MLALVLSSAGLTRATILVSTTFDSNDEGWSVGDFFLPNTTNSVPSYQGSDGNPGGFIRTSDLYGWTAYYAPAAFLGDQSAAYGGRLHLDERILTSDNVIYPMVAISDGISTYQFRTSPPGTNWTSYDIPLLASGGWEIADGLNHESTPGAAGPAVTEAQLQQLLSKLKFLRIDADWLSGSDQVDLDNVRLESSSVSVPDTGTLAATFITATSAQLNGSINPNDHATTAHFEYGTTTSYGTTTPSGNFGITAQNIGFNVIGLAPNTTYHYRIVAANAIGTAEGNDLTFTTTGTGSPAVQTFAATATTTTSAQLNGSINPNGFGTAAYFEYGLTTAYGGATASGNFGMASQNIGFVVTGLSPDTTYHFRIVAVNSLGTVRGSDLTLTTLPVATTAKHAWVAGTSGLGLRLRSNPTLSAAVLLVMPEGSSVVLLADTQDADGFLWRHLSYGNQTGWAAAQYLIFSLGTTPAPPAPPTTLRQLQADGFSPIIVGGVANAASVVLAATPSGPSSQQFSLQFEVRPSGTAFSDPTITRQPIQGGSEARAALGHLANQSYHWRARVLDGNGMPSEWVSFGANTTAFTVNAVTAPLANFNWNPAQVFTGDSITFTAQAAAQSGLIFRWNFGDAQTGMGDTVTHTFSQSGDVIVTLTVTDSQNNQSQQSLTVTVASKNLVTRINATAGQSEAMLDDILAKATLAAGAADYFKTGVDEAPNEIALTAALTGLSLIFDSDDTQLAQRCVDWTRQAYGDAAADRVLARVATHEIASQLREDFVSTISQWAISYGGQGVSYQQTWIPGLANLVTRKKAEIELLRQQAISAAGSLSPSQSSLLAQNLQSRLLGNYASQASYDTNANLPISFQDFKSSDESGWTTYNIGQHLFAISAGLLGTALGGMGGIVAGVAATASHAELDIFNTLASQSAEVQFMSLSLSVAGQGSDLVRQISANIETGLNEVITSQSPISPTGKMNSIFPYSQGMRRTYNLMLRWFATEAYADVVIQNTGQQAATYRVEAFFTKTFVTGQLPVHFLGVGQRQYDIQVATAQDGIALNAGAQTTARLIFLAGDGGLVPEGQDITYVLTSRTSDGYYRQDSQIQHFGTTYLDENGTVVDPALIASASVSQPPLQSSLLLFPGSNICQLKITVQNPLETPVLLDVDQDLPSGTTVINAAGGTYSNNHLSWQLNMQPGQFQFFSVVLQLSLPASNPPITNTAASAYDTVNDAWVQFSQAPVISQMTSSPPPQIQPTGLTSGTFGLGVQALIPGVYSVETTSDFIHWDPVITVTNIAGPFQVTDLTAQSHPVRFYRAAGLQ